MLIFRRASSVCVFPRKALFIASTTWRGRALPRLAAGILARRWGIAVLGVALQAGALRPRLLAVVAPQSGRAFRSSADAEGLPPVPHGPVADSPPVGHGLFALAPYGAGQPLVHHGDQPSVNLAQGHRIRPSDMPQIVTLPRTSHRTVCPMRNRGVWWGPNNSL